MEPLPPVSSPVRYLIAHSPPVRYLIALIAHSPPARAAVHLFHSRGTATEGHLIYSLKAHVYGLERAGLCLGGGVLSNVYSVYRTGRNAAATSVSM